MDVAPLPFKQYFPIPTFSHRGGKTLQSPDPARVSFYFGLAADFTIEHRDWRRDEGLRTSRAPSTGASPVLGGIAMVAIAAVCLLFLFF